MTSPATSDTCAPCAHAAEHGWWGPDHPGTHCRDCHRSWTSLAQAHCVTCHQQFVSALVADSHWCDGHGQRRHAAGCDGAHGRPWSPRHLDPASAGLYLGPDDIWSTSLDRDPSAAAARAANARRAAVHRPGDLGGPQ